MNRGYRGAALILLLLAGIVIAPCQAQIKEFSKWPAGTSPQEVGKRVAERFVANAQLSLTAPIYPTVCTWYGALNFAELSRDSELTTRLIQLFDTQLTPAVLDLVNQRGHVDFSVLGAVPLQIYIETKDKPYLVTGAAIADRQWEHLTADGLSGETRFWIDDMFMITILQVQAYRATGDAKYLDRAVLEMEAYLDRLQQSNGLFYHAPDTPYFWGRGNGWVAAGLTELLRSMPPDYPGRARIMAGYQKMMAALLKLQDKDGMWHQLLDHPEAWPETSSTGMFTFAMITGVKNGWLARKTYAPAARKGWLGLVSYINANGDVRNVCEGTGKKNDLDYYLNRARLTGDLHGQAPILWCAAAFLR